MDTDGNLAAINRYIREQDRAEKMYRAFIDELDCSIGDMVDEIISIHKAICNKYDIEEYISDYIGQR